jgi:hypothetical protein
MQIDIDNKDLQVIIQLLRTSDPTGLFTNRLGDRLFEQGKKQSMNNIVNTENIEIRAKPKKEVKEVKTINLNTPAAPNSLY